MYYHRTNFAVAFAAAIVTGILDTLIWGNIGAAFLVGAPITFVICLALNYWHDYRYIKP